MKTPPRRPTTLRVFFALLVAAALSAPHARAVDIPPDAWNLATARRDATPTRERVSLNGLWRWQPAVGDAGGAPSDAWGAFKVPGCWPGLTDYMQKDSWVVRAHSDWKGYDAAGLRAAWYERRVTVPAEWSDRRIALGVEYLSSFARVEVDGAAVGEMRFPAGELDLSAVLRPGKTHKLRLLVLALPLEAVRLAFTDSAAAREVRGTVRRRGLLGDVWLVSAPPGPRVRDVRVETSVREGRWTLRVGIDGLGEDDSGAYRLRAVATADGRVARELDGPRFTARDLENGRFHFAGDWRPERLWDLHTPGNTFDVSVSLLDSAGDVLDVAHAERFGFRELWIDGRDIRLNGSRVHLTAVPVDNAQVGAALAYYDGARETFERLKGLGIEFVYTHNYDCQPGSHLSFAEILRAADDVGVLVALSQPHFSDYRWEDSSSDPNGADAANGYSEHAAFYARVAGNHPSVVLYAMSHNATGYSEDMDPFRMDGSEPPRDSWALRNVGRARKAEAIVRRIDPGRIVYHHASGDLGSMHTSNFYPNFVPRQELADWFETWSQRGTKPLFLCEFGGPLSWDWAMYRGWYRGEREFGSAAVPWELAVAEWNAPFVGDRAYAITEREARNLRWEAQRFREGRTWHRWDYPTPVGSSAFAERHPIYAAYFRDVWRAMRTYGVSAVCPWDHGHYWTLRDGVDRTPVTFTDDPATLQRPGIRPDVVDARCERFDIAFEREDWTPTVAGEAFIAANRRVLAWIAGGPESFTDRQHLYRAGESLAKQLIVVNDSRVGVRAECEWELALPVPVRGRASVTVEPGEQTRIPLRFELPPTLAPGERKIRATVRLGGGETLHDAFTLRILAPSPTVEVSGRIALFDPRGETGAWLNGLGVEAERVDADVDLARFDLLIVGKGALTVSGPAPDLRRVEDGLRVVVFEQTAAALERRLGFRIAEIGLRELFPRIPDHPILDGLDADALRDWRGAATLSAPRLDYELRPRHGPTVEWCGIPVTRLWRCGNRGSVASVVIEEPPRGDWRPIVDGGFALQYAALLEHRAGRGVVIFCQADVTGRTASDPAAERLAGGVLRYAYGWRAAPRRRAVWAGELEGKRWLEAAGVTVGAVDADALATDHVLVAGPGSGSELEPHAAKIARWLDAGGRVVAVGLDSAELRRFLPRAAIETTPTEHIATYFEAPGAASPFAGISPGDVHNRDPRVLPLVTAGAKPLGNGVLANAANGRVVLFQMAPWRWSAETQSFRRVFRRASFALARILANAGVASDTPALERFGRPATEGERRWLDGVYLDVPEEWDDPYRFFRW